MELSEQLEKLKNRLEHSLTWESSIQRTFYNAENWINKHFNILNAVRDIRENWGDDGGYLLTISEKDNKYYLHIVYITYNIDVESIDVNLNNDSATCDYVVFDNIPQVHTAINKFADILNRVIKKAKTYGRNEDTEIERWHLQEHTDEDIIQYDSKTLNFISSVIYPYWEYRENEEYMRNLAVNLYPKYWDARNNIQESIQTLKEDKLYHLHSMLNYDNIHFEEFEIKQISFYVIEEHFSYSFIDLHELQRNIKRLTKKSTERVIYARGSNKWEYTKDETKVDLNKYDSNVVVLTLYSVLLIYLNNLNKMGVDI